MQKPPKDLKFLSLFGAFTTSGLIKEDADFCRVIDPALLFDRNKSEW